MYNILIQKPTIYHIAGLLFGLPQNLSGLGLLYWHSTGLCWASSPWERCEGGHRKLPKTDCFYGLPWIGNLYNWWTYEANGQPIYVVSFWFNQQ